MRPGVFFSLMLPPPPTPTLFPYTTLFRSGRFLDALAIAAERLRERRVVPRNVGRAVFRGTTDRKSTRLNSSHRTISYAVFCLKKKSSDDDVGTVLHRLGLGLYPDPAVHGG